MTRSFVVRPRYRGPARSGNGGYVAGRLASFVEATCVEVTLRSPPALDVPLLISDDGASVVLRDGEVLVAQAKPAVPDDGPPVGVDWEIALEAAERYAGRREHPFPTCFVCGPDRAPGDGLRLEPGEVDQGRVAATWCPDESLLAEARRPVSEEFVWAALDCPGGWAAGIAGRPMVLGRMTAQVLAVPDVGDSCVVVGQLHETEGRKAFTSSALYAADGELLASATATWLRVDPASVGPRSRR